MNVRSLAFTIALVAVVGGETRAAVLVSTVNARSVDYVRFTSTGGDASFNIFGRGFVSGGNPGLEDSMIRLAEDNGSPIGALTGALVAVNDDSTADGFDSDGSTSRFDSFLEITALAPGNYILGVGEFDLEEDEFRSGVASTPGVTGDYQLTFEGVTLAAVPEPTSAVVFGLMSIGVIGCRRKRNRASA